METRGLGNTSAETSLTRASWKWSFWTWYFSAFSCSDLATFRPTGCAQKFILFFIMAVVSDFNRKVSDAAAVAQKNAGPQSRLSLVISKSLTLILFSNHLRCEALQEHTEWSPHREILPVFDRTRFPSARASSSDPNR